MLIRDNTMQVTNTIWIVGAIIIANIWLVAGHHLGFLLWLCFSGFILILETLRVNRELRRLGKELRFIEHGLKRKPKRRTRKR